MAANDDRAASYQDYGVTAEFYDQVVPYGERADVDFYVDAARASGGPVLEIGCGTGRILIPTARAGVDITGLDRSDSMLDICQSRLEAESAALRARVEIVKTDMRRFDLKSRFSLVTIPFRPFQHLPDVEDQLACLRSIHRHLEPGGRLILDVFNPSLDALTRKDIGEVLGSEPEFKAPDGRKVVRSHRILAIDRFNQINQVELIYDITHPDGRIERHSDSFPMRWFFRYEMEHLLHRADFEVQALYADFDKSEYGSKYPGDLIFVAGRI
jgi:SAM-dependent methyltransferase